MDEYAQAAIIEAVEAGSLDGAQLRKFLAVEPGAEVPGIDALPASVRQAVSDALEAPDA